MEQRELVIIGGGPAGLAAAVAAYDAGCRDILILDREERPGGILKQCIHSGFGLHKLGKELTGPEYAYHYAKLAEERHIPVLTNTMVTELSPDRVVTARNETGIVKLQADAVILAMGCRERCRGALDIPGSRPAGVYTAGTAQKLMNLMGYAVGKRVVILGSGDIGLIMARRLSLEGAKVEAVCEKMSYPGGLVRNLVQCLEDFDIPLYLSTTVVQIHGRDRVEGVTVAAVDEKGAAIENTKRYIPCDTLLLSVGLIPENELSRKAGIALDPVTGGAIVRENRETSVPGIFACGNVLQVHDLVDYVSEEAEKAGKSAAEFVLSRRDAGELLPVRAGKGCRYVVPQLAEKEKAAELYFRVSKPFGAVTLCVRSGETVLRRVKVPRAVPGEMVRIALSPDAMAKASDEITVSVEEDA